jgi:hypothetical protein
MPVTPAYAALLALLFIALAVRTIRLRRRLRVGIGDGNDRELARAVRVHANFAEYVPLALLLIWLLESGGAPAAAIHGLCAALLAGRLLHAWGVSRVREDLRFRVAGMALTFVAIAGAALGLLLRYAAALA